MVIKIVVINYLPLFLIESLDYTFPTMTELFHDDAGFCNCNSDEALRFQVPPLTPCQLRYWFTEWRANADESWEAVRLGPADRHRPGENTEWDAIYPLSVRAQSTLALFVPTAGHQPRSRGRASRIQALGMYRDFYNVFLYIFLDLDHKSRTCYAVIYFLVGPMLSL